MQPLLFSQKSQFVGTPVALALSANVADELMEPCEPDANVADKVALLLAAVALALADDADDDAEDADPAALLADVLAFDACVAALVALVLAADADVPALVALVLAEDADDAEAVALPAAAVLSVTSAKLHCVICATALDVPEPFQHGSE